MGLRGACPLTLAAEDILSLVFVEKQDVNIKVITEPLLCAQQDYADCSIIVHPHHSPLMQAQL